MSITPELFANNSYSIPFPLVSLIKKLEKGSLDINPDYQRGEVWNDQKKTELVQSIFGGIMLPPLVFNKVENQYTAIDGKQRLTAMRDFMNNSIDFYNEYDKQNSVKYDQLEEEYQDKFKDYTVNVDIYENLTRDQEREIFQRINYGENLSVGEKLKGLNSKIIKKILDVQSEIETCLKGFGISCKRESYMECIVALLAMYNKDYEFVSKGKLCIDYINKISINEDKYDIEEFKNSVCSAFNHLKSIWNDLGDYCKLRGYAKKYYKSLKWTDVLIFTKYLIDNASDIDKAKRNLTIVNKHLIHKQNNNQFVTTGKKDDQDNQIESKEYAQYVNIFGKRMNTNVTNYFNNRLEIIDALYKYTNKDITKTIREEVYAKTGTIGESLCKLCRKHKIYPDCFQAAHIISKKNGGCPETPNMFPTCSTCNTSMGPLDMDIYIKNNNINLKL